MAASGQCGYNVGDMVGNWRLVECLGAGGQGEVWKAARSDGLFALKLLKESNPQSEAFARFRRETELLRRLGNYPGIVPLADSDLNSSPPWMAMPIVTPIEAVLSTNWSLHEVVQGISQVAGTLHEFLDDRGISHRDVHPGNLFLYQGAWAIGDFGLARDPKSPQITDIDARWPRARSFIAPEMIDFPATAEGGPADVYSVAKSLWALAAREKYPPTGQIDAGTGMEGQPPHLSTEPRWGFVMMLLEAATSSRADERPTLEQVHDELQEWLRGELGSKPFRTLTFSPSFRRALWEVCRSDVERRQVIRALFLLDVNEEFPWLNVRELRPGDWRADASPVLQVVFERVNGQKRLVGCLREGVNPDAELWAELFGPEEG